MSFNNLSQTIQDLIMVKFHFFGKSFIVLLFFIWCMYYVFIYWKRKKETPFLMMGIVRGMLYVLSIMYLVVMPLLVFFFYPQLPVDNVMYFMIIFYFIGFFVLFIVFLINVLYIPPAMIGRLVGYSPMSEKDNKTLLDMFKIKWK